MIAYPKTTKCDIHIHASAGCGACHLRLLFIKAYSFLLIECLDSGHLTAKSDVYSFGVVLLEMLSGRRAVDKNRPSGEHNLVEWAKPYLANKRKVFKVIDNRLEGQYTLEEAHKAAALALRCLSMDSKFRPNMVDVVKALEEIEQLKETANVQARSNSGPRMRRHSADDARIEKRSVSYPRPSASPLYT